MLGNAERRDKRLWRYFDPLVNKDLQSNYWTYPNQRYLRYWFINWVRYYTIEILFFNEILQLLIIIFIQNVSEKFMHGY